jgi:hypothetical protein
VRRIGFFLVLCLFVEASAAATASGRNWRITIDRLECRAGVLTLATRIRYLGPKGPVESPVIRLVDAKGARHAPKSLVWMQGSKPVAEWLSGGGLTLLQSEDLATVQIRFEPRGAAGALELEFGDIRAFALTDGGGACIKVAQLKTPMRPQRKPEAKSALRVYRVLYPCRAKSGTSVVTDAQYPPYLPAQLLVFGHGYLPNAREISLPMGLAPAQSYAFSGLDDRKAIEVLARRVAASDFPQYGAARYFAYDWGVQRSASGNELQSVGIYELRNCP